MPAGYLAVLTGAAWVATLAGRPSSPGRSHSVRRARPRPRRGAGDRRDARCACGARLPGRPSTRCTCSPTTAPTAPSSLPGHRCRRARARRIRSGQGSGAAAGRSHAARAWRRRRRASSIVDADTIVAPDLPPCDRCGVRRGREVVQGYYRVRDAGDLGGRRASGRPPWRRATTCGLSAATTSAARRGLYGNGMAFRAGRSPRGRVHPSDRRHRAADGAAVRRHARRVRRRAPSSRREMPATLEAAMTQNERWERGRLELARRYVPRLVRRAGDTCRTSDRRRRRRCSTTLVPPLSVLVAAVGAVAVADIGVPLSARRRHRAKSWLRPRRAPSSSTCCRHRPRRRRGRCTARSLDAPEMIRWKMRLWLRMLAEGDEVDWVRTARTERPSMSPTAPHVPSCSGVPVDDVTLDEAVDRIAAMVDDRSGDGSHPPGGHGQRRLRRQRPARTASCGGILSVRTCPSRTACPSCGRSRLLGTRSASGRPASICCRHWPSGPPCDGLPDRACSAPHRAWRTGRRTSSGSAIPAPTITAVEAPLVAPDGTMDAAAAERSATPSRHRVRRPRQPQAGELDRPPRRSGRRPVFVGVGGTSTS